MKSSFALPASLTLLSLLTLLSGCGQPGPLYLPKPPARAAAKATPPAPAPALPSDPATGTPANNNTPEAINQPLPAANQQ